MLNFNENKRCLKLSDNALEVLLKGKFTLRSVMLNFGKFKNKICFKIIYIIINKITI